MIYDDDGCWWEGVPLVEDIIASAGNYNNNYTHNTQQAEFSRYNNITHE